MRRCCPVVELRQYTLHPGTREDFTYLFERNFVAPQEALGIRILGIFRDLDDPDRFVWIRGFESMEARGATLPAFYGGPVWQALRDEANSRMLDSDNVLMLRPQGEGGGFALPERETPPGVILAAVHYLEAGMVEPFGRFFETRMAPALAQDGGRMLAAFVSENAPNNFPRLPIRAQDHVLAWFARFESEASLAAFLRLRNARRGWREGAPESLMPAFMRKPELIRLAPASTSRLH